MNGAVVSSLVGSVVALIGVIYTVYTSRRGQVFNEVQTLKANIAKLERRVRAATTYIDVCMDDYRRRGIDPPPIPNRALAPWEE